MSRLAIQADRIGQPAERTAFSGRWLRVAAERGIETRVVDVRALDFFGRVGGCDAFLWRFGVARLATELAKKLLPSVEQGLGIPAFPSAAQAWWAEDKLAQHFLLKASGLPYPESWLFWDATSARDFCGRTKYPLVLKLATGFGSANVALLRDRREAEHWIDRLFGHGVRRLDQRVPSWSQRRRRDVGAVLRVLRGRDDRREQGYFFVQEFLQGNAFDTRITVIGNRAFGFRRLNRPDDFRASGSGNIDWTPEGVDLEAVRLGIDVARHLGTECLAVDVMRRGDAHVVTEMNFSFRASAVDACPGHWTFAERGHEPRWRAGQVYAADAILEDVLVRIAQPAG